MRDLYLHFADPNILVHRPVAHKAVQRTIKACGLVFFKIKMADFGNAVTAEQTVQQVLRLASRYPHGRADKTRAEAENAAGVGSVCCALQVCRAMC